MGNFRQHVGLSAFLGVLYAWGTFVLVGLHWLYGAVAALLATLGGLLPDLDSSSSVKLRGFVGVLGVLASVFVWRKLSLYQPGLAFELHLWAAILAFLSVRYGIRLLVIQLTVHRGMSHSIPTGAVWAELTYLYYPSPYHSVRLMMAVAVFLGFLSHLVLDEVCSVDLRGARVNRAFGSALKFWARSPLSTIAMYALLAYLTWRVIQVWPSPPHRLDLPVPAPRLPDPRFFSF